MDESKLQKVLEIATRGFEGKEKEELTEDLIEYFRQREERINKSRGGDYNCPENDI